MAEYRPRTVAAQKAKSQRERIPTLKDVGRAVIQKGPPLFTPTAAFRLDPGPHAIIHRAYNRMVWARARKEGGRRRLWLKLFAYPLVWLWRVPVVLMRHGAETARISGKSRARQFFELLSLAYSHSIPPNSYYLFRLFDEEPRRRAAQYIHRFETKAGLFNYLNTHLGHKREASELLGNKRAFAQRCRECDLPTPELYLEIANGEVIPHQWDQPGLPPVDLIVKRRKGKGGHVMMRWEVQPDGSYLGDTGDRLGANELLDLLKRDSQSMELIVVRRLVNHPDIRCFAGPQEKILTTCRLMTARNETGDPEVVSATLKIAVRQSVADNVHFGGLASPIDVHTGTLGPAIATEPLGVPVDVHPLSGAPITGAKLPMWDDAIALAGRAHLAFPEAVFIGWDIGLTPEGPSLVEGNSGPCVHLQQTPHGAPLGAGRFAEIMAYHLEQIEAASAG